MSSTYLINYKSRRTDVFCKKGILKNLTRFTGKHLYQSLFLKKVAGLRPANSKTGAKFLRTPFFNKTPPMTASAVADHKQQLNL